MPLPHGLPSPWRRTAADNGVERRLGVLGGGLRPDGRIEPTMRAPLGIAGTFMRGTACPEADWDRRASSSGGGDGVAVSKIVRRSGYQTLRPAPPKPSRMGMHATSRIPPRRIPGSVSTAPTRDRTVGLCRGIALPQPGGESGRICVSVNCAKTVTFSPAPRPPPASTSAFWSDGQGPRRTLLPDRGADPPSVVAVLDEPPGGTSRPVRAIVRAGSAGLTVLAVGPWLTGLPLDLLDRLSGALLKALPIAFGRGRYRAGFVARRLAEDLEPFRMLEAVVRDVALGRSGGPSGHPDGAVFAWRLADRERVRRTSG